MNNLTCRITAGQKSLRSACDLCHQGKVKCSGGTPCEGCRKLGVLCKYSASNRTGRPKGVKNKKTLERIKQLRAAHAKEKEETRVTDNQPSSVRISRRPSVCQCLLHEQPDQVSLPMPSSLSDNSCGQADSNLSPVPDISPESTWSYFPISGPGNFSDTEHLPSLAAAKGCFSCHVSGDQEPSANSFQSPDSFELLPAGKIPDYSPPELSWVDTLFTTTELALPECGDMDDILKRPQGTDQDSSGMHVSKAAGVHPSQPQKHTSSVCHCVRHITEQLASFKALSGSPQRLQPDFVLTVARDSLVEWQPYLQCPSCEYSVDKDILFLSVMALRALFNLIQEIGLQHEYQSRHDDTQEEVTTASDLSAPFLNSQDSFLGTYRLVCEEKRLVVDLLLYRTLKSLYRTAKILREKSLRMTGTASKRNSTSNRSSRSPWSASPLVASPIICYGLPHKVTMSGRSEGLDSTGFNISLDEHDNYLQKSLQNLMANIESHLMKIQTPQSIQGQRDADTFVF